MESQQQQFSEEMQALAMLQVASLGIGQLLAKPEFNMLRMRIQGHLSKAMGGIQRQSGIYVGQSANAQSVDDFIANLQPLESVGGESLGRVRPLNPEELVINDDTKEQFLAKRDELVGRYLDMSDDQLFKLQREPNGETLLRSVAKVMGMPDYRTAPIDVQFLETTRQNIVFQNSLMGSISGADTHSTRPDSSSNFLDDDDDDNGNQAGPEYGNMLARMRMEGAAMQPKELAPGAGGASTDKHDATGEQKTGTDSTGAPLAGQEGKPGEQVAGAAAKTAGPDTAKDSATTDKAGTTTRSKAAKPGAATGTTSTEKAD